MLRCAAASVRVCRVCTCLVAPSGSLAEWRPADIVLCVQITRVESAPAGRRPCARAHLRQPCACSRVCAAVCVQPCACSPVSVHTEFTHLCRRTHVCELPSVLSGFGPPGTVSRTQTARCQEGVETSLGLRVAHASSVHTRVPAAARPQCTGVGIRQQGRERAGSVQGAGGRRVSPRPPPTCRRPRETRRR